MLYTLVATAYILGFIFMFFTKEMLSPPYIRWPVWALICAVWPISLFGMLGIKRYFG